MRRKPSLSRSAGPQADSSKFVPSLNDGARVATYAQRIKNKTAKTRTPARRPDAKASARPAPATPAPAAPAKPEAPSAPPAAPGELERLKDELQRVNQEISRIGRESRPDAARQTHLPEKQELLRQKADLDRKIRAASKT